MLEDVEKYVYEHDDLRASLGYVWEHEFLSFHFRTPESPHLLKTLIHAFLRDTPPVVEMEQLIWQAEITRTARQLTQGDIEIHRGACQLWREWFFQEQEPWNDPDFAVYGLLDAAIEDYFEGQSQQKAIIDEAIIKETIARYHDDVLRASYNLLRRFDPYYV